MWCHCSLRKLSCGETAHFCSCTLLNMCPTRECANLKLLTDSGAETYVMPHVGGCLTPSGPTHALGVSKSVTCCRVHRSARPSTPTEPTHTLGARKEFFVAASTHLRDTLHGLNAEGSSCPPQIDSSSLYQVASFSKQTRGIHPLWVADSA